MSVHQNHICKGCGRKFQASEDYIKKHSQTCTDCRSPSTVKNLESMTVTKWQETLDNDREKNPHLALVSDHLWWIALVSKIGLIMMLISILITISLS